MKSCSRDVNHPFAQLYPCCICYPPISHLGAALVIRLTIMVPNYLCSSNPYVASAALTIHLTSLHHIDIVSPLSLSLSYSLSLSLYIYIDR
jgi:hypothetical protein